MLGIARGIAWMGNEGIDMDLYTSTKHRRSKMPSHLFYMYLALVLIPGGTHVFLPTR